MPHAASSGLRLVLSPDDRGSPPPRVPDEGRPAHASPAAAFVGHCRWVWVIAIFRAAFHAAISTRYERFRDEYYFLDLSKHIDWGYVDIGPVLPALTRVSTALLGPGLFAERLPQALCGGASVLLAGRTAAHL